MPQSDCKLPINPISHSHAWFEHVKSMIQERSTYVCCSIVPSSSWERLANRTRRHMTETPENSVVAHIFQRRHIESSPVSPVQLLSLVVEKSKMRAHFLARAQPLAASSLRCSARSASRVPSRCALSTAAASRTRNINGAKPSIGIHSRRALEQRRWQSVAAQV